MMGQSKLRKRAILLLALFLFIPLSSPLFARFHSEIAIKPGKTFTTPLNSDQQFLGIIRFTVSESNEYNLSIFDISNSIILTRVTDKSLEVHFIGKGNYTIRIKNLSNEELYADLIADLKNLEETADGHYISTGGNYSCWKLLLNSNIKIISVEALTTGRYRPYVTMLNKGGDMFLYISTINPTGIPNWGSYTENYTIHNQKTFGEIEMEKNEKIWFLLRTSSYAERQIVFTFVRTYIEKENYGTSLILLLAAFFAFVGLSWNKIRKSRRHFSSIARKNEQKVEEEVNSMRLVNSFTFYSDIGKRKSRK